MANFDFEAHVTADTESIVELVARVVAEDAASAPFIDKIGLEFLLDEVTALPFRRARTKVIVNEKTVVTQDFELCSDLPAAGAFWHCVKTFERRFNKALAAMVPCPVTSPLRLNDVMVQRYASGSKGISPHRDHIRYRGLIALLVLSGHGRYFICKDREGSAAREIPASPGYLILMRAPDFANRKDRPFHYLTDITSERYSFGIRYNSTI